MTETISETPLPVSVLEQIRHPFAPERPAESPAAFVTEYLATVRGKLGIPEFAIADLGATSPDETGSGPASPDGGLRLRWARRFAYRHDAIVFLIQQTASADIVSDDQSSVHRGGVDVERAGLRVLVELKHGKPFAIRGIVSTLFHGEILSADQPIDTTTKISRALVRAVASASGLPTHDLDFLSDQPSPVFLQRFTGTPVPALDAAPLVRDHFYPVRTFRFRDPIPTEVSAWIPWNSRHEPQAVPIRATGLGANAGPSGMVFLHDPFTASGNLSLRRNAASITLKSARKSVPFPALTIPAAGARWELKSSGLHVDGGDPIGVPGETVAAPPTSALGAFNYEVRTNDFAAVNAYYHTQSMLDELDRFSLSLSTFAMVTIGRTSAVLQVIPRATITPGPCHDGNCINAQAEIIPGAPQTLQMRFALADLQRLPGQPDKPAEPLGIACDVRVVWHEFCHVLISAATDYPEFPFAHSAGDALAAISGDPHSRLRQPVGPYHDPLRFDTFPWGTAPNRRHDRDWAWTGPQGTEIGYSTDIRDMSGYAREQVLSSTLFRYYRAIGGDSDKLSMRNPAADLAHFVIISAIYMQGDGKTVPATSAASFLNTLLAASVAHDESPPPYKWIGGVTNKVLQWAFEQQHLPPLNGIVLPDIYVSNKERNGDYAWTPHWHAGPEGIWNGDASGNQQTPQPGMLNTIFVAVQNRSTTQAQNVSVSVYLAETGSDGVFPNVAWQSIPPATGSSGPQSQALATDTLIFGPFEWTPKAGQHYTIFAAAECPDDPSNTDVSAKLPCSYLPTPLELLVRFDNNLAARRLSAP